MVAFPPPPKTPCMGVREPGNTHFRNVYGLSGTTQVCMGPLALHVIHTRTRTHTKRGSSRVLGRHKTGREELGLTGTHDAVE